MKGVSLNGNTEGGVGYCFEGIFGRFLGLFLEGGAGYLMRGTEIKKVFWGGKAPPGV